jgi:predicted Zn-dependent protease
MTTKLNSLSQHIITLGLVCILAACSSQPQRPNAQADHRAIQDMVEADNDSADFQPSVASHPAVLALFQGAHTAMINGDLRTAASKLERAQRIAPKDAAIYYRLAVVRLKQNQSTRAEHLALKSISLAQRNKKFKAYAWELVAQARDEQGDYAGTKKARNKAAQF